MRQLIAILLLCSTCFGMESFTTGQTTPLMEARSDFPKYPSASRIMENMFIYPQGPVTRRPGTRYIADVNGGGDCIPTEYPVLRAADDTEVPEMTHTIAISSLADLNDIRNDMTGNYYLTTNIDASATTSWNDGTGWQPIGEYSGVSYRFKGTFDGCGYTITGLYINDPNQDNGNEQGLFGYAGPGTIIANLTLADVNMTFHKGGALVGCLFDDSAATDAPKIYNCHSTGIIMHNWDLMGAGGAIAGLVGTAVGYSSSKRIAIYDSTSSCTVDATNYHTTVSMLGPYSGFIGRAGNTDVNNCNASGNVTATPYGPIPGGKVTLVGGFLGYGTSIYTFINDCHATGNVTAGHRVGCVGGFVGACYGKISRCYATGNVDANDVDSSVGGFLGEPYGSCVIKNCYAWGNVTGTGSAYNQYLGGFVGRVYTNNQTWYCYSIGAVSNTEGKQKGGFCGDGNFAALQCFWDTETSGIDTSYTTASGKTTAEMKCKTTYTSVGNEWYYWDFDTIWYMLYLGVAAAPGARLIPFEYSTDNAYVLSLGSGYIHFFRTTE